jgi:single-strand DNA-binding protein
MNSVNLLGRLVADPEMFKTNSGVLIAKVRLAVDGRSKDDVLFIDVKFFNKTAELIEKYFKKGSQVGVSGSLSQENWETKEGNKRSRLVVLANNISFVGSKDDNFESNTNKQVTKAEPEDDYDPF